MADSVRAGTDSRSFDNRRWTSLLSGFAIVNSAPVVAVLVFQWDLLSVVLLYWLETGFLALLAAARMAMAGQVDHTIEIYTKWQRWRAKVWGILGSLTGFAMFWLVSLILIFIAFDGEPGQVSIRVPELMSLLSSFGIAVLIIAAGHLLHFFNMFVRNGVYRHAAISDQGDYPMLRIYTLILICFIGLFLVAIFAETIYTTMVIVLLKAVLDGWSISMARA